MSIRANNVSPYKNNVLHNVLPSPRPKIQPREFIPPNNEPSLNPEKYQIVIDQAFINNLVQDLYQLTQEKLGKQIGFIPSPKSENKIDILVGKKASQLAKSLEEAVDIEQLKILLEKSIKFINLLEFIETLQKIAKDRKELPIGLKPKSPLNEDVILGIKAENLAIALIANPSNQVASQVDEFLILHAIITKLENIADRKLNKSQLGFIRQSVTPRNEKLGQKAQELASALKISPDKNSLMAAYNFLQTLEGKKQEYLQEKAMQGKNNCVGFHCTRANRRHSRIAV